jgi:hypothetical protein
MPFGVFFLFDEGGLLLTRAVTDGRFISFSRVARGALGQPQQDPHPHMGGVQEEAEGMCAVAATSFLLDLVSSLCPFKHDFIHQLCDVSVLLILIMLSPGRCTV